MKFLKYNPLMSIVNSYTIDSPTSSNISYVWNLGSILGLILVLQIVTGVTLGFHYCADLSMAFDSIEHIHRDVQYGALIRYAHANGAAFFFIIVYAHIAKSLYYSSYKSPRQGVWAVGIIIFVLMMATAFIGYVLPFGAMSYWGATVITSMFSAIPYIGTSLTEFIWGGFSVSNATLTRFFALHYLLPFILIAFVIIHLIYLHTSGSSNPLGVTTNTDKLPFHPYFIFKDLFGFFVFFILFVVIVAYFPNLLGHSDNYIMADPLVTPSSIVPEFYFLPFYAILRAVPSKLGGVVAMFAAILILFVCPLVDTSRTRGGAFNPLHRLFFWLFVANFFILTWLGGEHATQTYVLLSRISSIIYFAHFLIILPLISYVHNNTLFRKHTLPLTSFSLM